MAYENINPRDLISTINVEVFDKLENRRNRKAKFAKDGHLDQSRSTIESFLKEKLKVVYFTLYPRLRPNQSRRKRKEFFESPEGLEIREFCNQMCAPILDATIGFHRRYPSAEIRGQRLRETDYVEVFHWWCLALREVHRNTGFDALHHDLWHDIIECETPPHNLRL